MYNQETSAKILIPAYQPDETLVKLIKKLRNITKREIIIINDGSNQKSQKIFNKCKDTTNLTRLTHPKNQGKGTAIKTGISYIKSNAPNSAGAITADADGQHAIADILALCEMLEANEHSKHPKKHLWLGTRNFSGSHVPLASKIGNNFSAIMFRIAGGGKLNDTQTGLRGIPSSLFTPLLKINRNGFDYETDMLLIAIRHGYSLKQINIQTLYKEGNPSSHFHPIKDALKIMSRFIHYLIIGKTSITAI